MSEAIESADKHIERLIKKMTQDLDRLSTNFSDEETKKIVNRIATLRASMNPPCICEKKD